LPTVGLALSGIRKAKSDAKVKQRTEVLSGQIHAPASLLDQLRPGFADLKSAGNARDLQLIESDGELQVLNVELAPAEDVTAQ
ncbi:hypothetical protein, partial [Glutamicibacter creatinolyticus]